MCGGGGKLDHDITGYRPERPLGKGVGTPGGVCAAPRAMIVRFLAVVLLLCVDPGIARRRPALRVGVQSAFVVDPHVLFIGPNMAAARHLYDSLVGKDADAHWTPTLATAWRQIDALTWEFTLRPDVRFSDGSPFTSDDVIASVRAFPRSPIIPVPTRPTCARSPAPSRSIR